jgi:hypothetical protein
MYVRVASNSEGSFEGSATMTNYDFTKLDGLEFVRGAVDDTVAAGRHNTFIPAAYERLRSGDPSGLEEITDKQWDMIEMLVAIHDKLLAE